MVYLDSSAIVKRYVLEEGTDLVQKAYTKALQGETKLSFSVWNIGEALGVLNIYQRRKWLERKDHKTARESLITETLRLIKLGLIRTIPVRTKLLTKSWALIEKHHIYQADALQIVSAKYINADQLLSGDKKLVDISKAEGINATYLS
jgi:predicted nucleic acid-binding protein